MEGKLIKYRSYHQYNISLITKYNHINGLINNGYNLHSLNPIEFLRNKLKYEERDLCELDIFNVKQIYLYIKYLVLRKSIPINFFEYIKISNIMIRCHKLIMLKNNKHFEIRFNIFTKYAETFIHDHGTNFISICISGGFVHDVWKINKNHKNKHYHKYQRIDAFTMKYCGKQPGQVEHSQKFIHEKGKTYFLDRDILHTVCTPNSKMYSYLNATYSLKPTKNNILNDHTIKFLLRSVLLNNYMVVLNILLINMVVKVHYHQMKKLKQ